MSKITYKETFKIVVYTDGCASGSIRKCGDKGYQFREHGGERGKVYDTVEEVKAELEK